MKAIQRLLGLQILCLSIAIQFATAFATLPDHRTSPSRRRRPQHFASDDNIIIEELPLDYPRRKDVLIAIEAVRKACSITRQLQPITDAAATTIGTVQKSDFSPVTVADYAVQSVVLDHLNGASFPHCDGFIAEEDSASLRADEDLCKQVMHATGTILLDRDAVLAAIDLGKSYKKWEEPSHERPSRVWCLDPIDGTRGFLRGKRSGGQYCVALALLENGKPTIGVLGCPNLPTRVHDEDFVWRDDETEENNQSERGCIFVASRGGGCYQLPLFPNGQSGSRLQVTPSDGSSMPLTDARFCIGVEKYSDALGQCAGMAQTIHGEDVALDKDGEIIKERRMDSQAKHGVIARGGAEFYVRLPNPGYVEWIWDHAAGNVVIEEAGGEMTDTLGRPIDFSLGANLSPDVRGVLMSNGGIFHKALVAAFAVQEGKQLQS